MNKRASMQLGINAIVVLIIALAILGLAISFVTNLFRKGEYQLGGIITNVEMPVRADSGEPIKFDLRDVSVKAGSMNTQIKVSVYNNNNFDETLPVKLFLDCFDPISNAPYDYLDIGAPSQIIPLGVDVGYGAVLMDIADDGTPPGTYPCRVIASTATDRNTALTDIGAVSGQVYITIRT